MALMLLADRKSNIPLFYYVLAGIALTVIILAIYHLIVAVCYRRRRLPGRRIDGEAPTEARCGCRETPNIRLIPAYKYSKEVGLARGSGNECAVCLSAFVDGEEIRQLPECGHAFHMPCVDMWLDSHSNCPLCRARVVAPHRLHQIPVAEAGVEGGGPPNSGDLA